MSYPQGFFLLILPFSLAFLVSIISWKYADFFLSRKDYYVSSPYNLFIKKMGWAISSFSTTWLIATKFLAAFFKEIL